MQKLPISVFIIAKNEADRITRPIQSTIDWVDEVIVIDSGSEDDTVAVSEKLGARVLFNAWQGYGVQKIFGENQCRNKWIINIDGDEEISPALVKEIKALFANGQPPLKAYMLKITIVHRFDHKAHPLAPTNAPIRLYHRDYASFDSPINGLYHDSVIIREGKIQPCDVGMLKNRIYHRSIRSISHSVEKANFCTTMQAKEKFEKGKQPTLLRIMAEPLLCFLKAYFLRRYFVYGFNGFVDSVIFGYTKFIRLAKTREYFLEEEFKQENRKM